MTWVELSVVVATEAVEATTVLFEAYGMASVMMESRDLWNEGWVGPYGEIYSDIPADLISGTARITGYIPSAQYQSAVRESLERDIHALKDVGLRPGDARVTIREVEEEDWENGWKQFYHARRISPRLAVCPEWEHYEPKDHEQVIRLDPGMAFGTGTHPTTELCMQMLDRVVGGGERVIDVGCGSAILSIAAAKLGASEVRAVDLDPLAVDVANQNVQRNEVESIVHVERRDLLNTDQEAEFPPHHWDVIVANILAEVVVRLIPQTPSLLSSHGWLILSGIIESRYAWVEETLREHGYSVEDVARLDDWCAVLARPDVSERS